MRTGRSLLLPARRQYCDTLRQRQLPYRQRQCREQERGARRIRNAQTARCTLPQTAARAALPHQPRPPPAESSRRPASPASKKRPPPVQQGSPSSSSVTRSGSQARAESASRGPSRARGSSLFGRASRRICLGLCKLGESVARRRSRRRKRGRRRGASQEGSARSSRRGGGRLGAGRSTAVAKRGQCACWKKRASSTTHLNARVLAARKEPPRTPLPAVMSRRVARPDSPLVHGVLVFFKRGARKPRERQDVADVVVRRVEEVDERERRGVPHSNGAIACSASSEQTART